MIKIFYDVETTGTRPNRNSIIQLSGLIEKDGEIIDSFNFDVAPHPKAEIDESALRVNKTSLEDLKYFPPMKEVHRDLTRLLSKYVNKFDKKDKAWLIGFNNRAFDDFFLRKFFELCGDNFIGSWFWTDTIDVLCLASEYLINRRSDMPSFKLKRVAIELGVVVDKEKLHDSMYDVYLTREIYRIVTGLEIEI